MPSVIIKPCPRCGSGMVPSPSGEGPWTCLHCAYQTDDPNRYEGGSSARTVSLVLKSTSDVDHDLISTLRSIDQLFSQFTLIEMAKRLRSASGLRIAPIPLWQANKIRFALKGTSQITTDVSEA